MKQERGITTASIIIYVIAITISLAILSVISSYFYKTINENTIKNETSKKYTTFVSYFIQDIQEKGNSVLETGVQNNAESGDIYYIQFSNGNLYKYSYNNKIIYKNNVKICDNVEFCGFSYTQLNEKKQEITVEFISGDFKKIKDSAMKFYIDIKQ